MPRIIEKWKAKKTYALRAPALFGNAIIGNLLATDPATLRGRIVEISLRDLTRNPAHLYTLARLRVTDVNGEARTQLIGHEMAREWLATFIRKRRKVLDIVFDVATRDAALTLKGFVVAQRCSRTQRAALRRVFVSMLRERAQASTCEEFYTWLFSPQAMQEVINKLRRIVPIHRADVRASVLREH